MVPFNKPLQKMVGPQGHRVESIRSLGGDRAGERQTVGPTGDGSSRLDSGNMAR
jgi:hypothetical protein